MGFIVVGYMQGVNIRMLVLGLNLLAHRGLVALFHSFTISALLHRLSVSPLFFVIDTLTLHIVIWHTN